MICPKCRNELQKQMFGFDDSVPVNVCPACEGMWFDKGDLNMLDESVIVNSEEADFTEVADQKENLDCPGCGNLLHTVSPDVMPELEIESCTSCRGFWLDKNELEGIRDMTLKLESNQYKNIKISEPGKKSTFALWFEVIAGSFFR